MFQVGFAIEKNIDLDLLVHLIFCKAGGKKKFMYLLLFAMFLLQANETPNVIIKCTIYCSLSQAYESKGKTKKEGLYH